MYTNHEKDVQYDSNDVKAELNLSVSAVDAPAVNCDEEDKSCFREKEQNDCNEPRGDTEHGSDDDS